MELHQVRYFLAVCETLNFTRAAKACDVAQPSLTRAIIKLEQELGGPLFRRERSRTHLTNLGQLMRPHMEQILGAAKSARSDANDFATLDRAPMSIGVMCTIGPSRLVNFFARMRAEIPAIQLNLRESRGTILVEEMLSGDLDIALIGLPDLPDRLDARPLFSERYMIAFPRSHRFAGMLAVPVGELAGEDYLERVNCEFPDYYAAERQRPFAGTNVIYRSEREDWIQAMVVAGMGCAVMPEFLPTMPGIATRPLVKPELHRTVSIVTVAGRRFSPPVQALTRLAKTYDWNGSP